ncbi:MAG: hypothetical protein WBB32_06430 [Flavobacteriales bacterium]
MNHRTTSILLILTAIACLLFACKKEPLARDHDLIEQARNALKKDKVPNWKDCFKGFKGTQCGMLEFEDASAFNISYACLNASYEAHLTEFEDAYGHLSEEEMDEVAETTGFVDEKPLIDFEIDLTFFSYRAMLESEENDWLDNGGEPEDGPGAFAGSFDDVLSTLLNENGAVMIAGEIHVLLEDGSWIIFCNCEEYGKYINSPEAYSFEDNPCAIQATPQFSQVFGTGGCCNDYGRRTGVQNWGASKNLWEVEYAVPTSANDMWAVYGTRAIACVVNYKKVNNKWKKRRAKLTVGVLGAYQDMECEYSGTITDTKGKKRRKLRIETHIPGDHPYKTGEMEGYWEWFGNSWAIPLPTMCP